MGTPTTQLVLLVCVALAAGFVALRLRRWFERRQTQRRFQRGRIGEVRAAELLSRAGYDVLAEQTTRETGLWVDDAWQPVRVRADFLVERKGRQYVVEVKTGRSATRPTSTATRRQLFEYHHVYDADGLILADMESDRLHLIRFDSAARLGRTAPQLAGWALPGLLVLGAVLGAATTLWWIR